jgi:flagellar protein FlaF
MNAVEMARTAYAPTAAPIRTGRAIEYDVFARTTHRLKAAAAAGPARFPELAAALHDNRRLWTVLAGDVADADNDLPRDLRARIFYLAEFTVAHSRKVLDGEATADALVEINTAIMRGLRAQIGDAA